MNKVKVGAARASITPPLETPMAGHFYKRFVKGFIDDIYATAIVFGYGENNVVILNLEICELVHKWWVVDLKKEISDFCEISAERIIINCTHTHTGPALVRDAANDVDGNKEYEKFLVGKLCDTVCKAIENMSEAKFFFASNTVKDVAFYRIYRMKDGSIKTNPGVSNPDILCPLSQPDETLTLVKITREGEKDIILTNYGLHPDTIGGELVSGDWPGVLREIVEKAYPDTLCVFLQGCEGDINTTDVRWKTFYKDYTRAQRVGRKMAAGVLQVMDDAVEFFADEISFASETLKIPTNSENHRLEEAERILKLHAEGRDDEITSDESMITTIVAEAYRIVSLKDAPEYYEAEVTMFNVGKLAFVSLPGEPFCEIGTRIKEKSSFPMTMVCVLNGSCEYYYPTTEVMNLGGYEAKSSVVKPGADDIIVNSTVEMINRIYEK